jgi:hypothetical protein
MIPFFPFERAVYYLKKIGCFRLADGQLGGYQLKALQNLLLRVPTKKEFFLSNVVIILYEADQMAWFDYKNEQAELISPIQPFLLNSATTKYPFFQARQSKLEEELLHVLVNYEWEKIILRNVFFVWCREKVVLSERFVNQLFAQLERKQKKVKTLVLEGSLYRNIQPFIQYISYNDQLEVLHYEMAYPAIQDFQKWLEKGYTHPTLKKIILGCSQLDEASYHMLNHFLDHNYCLDEIVIKRPENQKLDYLWLKLKQRLEKPPMDRFKAEKLNQASLLQLVKYFLHLKIENPLAKLLRSDNSTKTSRYPYLKENKIDELWPLVYQNYQHYFQPRDWVGKIDIQDKVEGRSSITVGAYLLGSMALTKDAWGTEFLLERGANPFERVQEHSLLTRFLQEKKPSQWSSVILKNIIQGTPTLLTYLAQKNELRPIYLRLYALEAHLINYFGLLYRRMHYTFLTRFFTGLFFCLETRKEEMIQAFQVLATLIENSDPQKMSDGALLVLQEDVKQWVKCARQTKRGLRGRSVLNDGIERLGFTLEENIMKMRHQFFGKQTEYQRLPDQEKEKNRSATSEIIHLDCFV